MPIDTDVVINMPVTISTATIKKALEAHDQHVFPYPKWLNWFLNTEDPRIATLRTYAEDGDQEPSIYHVVELFLDPSSSDLLGRENCAYETILMSILDQESHKLSSGEYLRRKFRNKGDIEKLKNLFWLLNDNNLFNEEILEIIAQQQNFFELADAIDKLQKEKLLPGLFTLETEIIRVTLNKLKALVTHPKPRIISNILIELHRSKDLFNKRNVTAILTHSNSEALGAAICASDARILTQADFDALMNAKAHRWLQDVATQINFTDGCDSVANWFNGWMPAFLNPLISWGQSQVAQLNYSYSNPKLQFVFSIIEALKKAHAMTSHHRVALMTHDDPESLFPAIENLRLFEIATVENIVFLLNCRLDNSHQPQVLEYIALSFFWLHAGSILTDENRALVANHPDPEKLFFDLSDAAFDASLSQEKFYTCITDSMAPRVANMLLYSHRFLPSTREQHRDALSAHRHENGFAQRDYDMHFGLTTTR